MIRTQAVTVLAPVSLIVILSSVISARSL
jgi:hypothetical protein